MTSITMHDPSGVQLQLSPYRNAFTQRHEVGMMLTGTDGTPVAFELNAKSAGVLIAAIRTAMIGAAALDFGSDT